MDRQLLAYLLIGLIALAIAAIVTFQLYHSHNRTYRRRILKEHADQARGTP